MKLLARTVEEHTMLELTLDEFTIEQALQVLDFLKREKHSGRWGKDAYRQPRLRIRVPMLDEEYLANGRVVFEAVLPDPPMPQTEPLPHFDLMTELIKEENADVKS